MTPTPQDGIPPVPGQAEPSTPEPQGQPSQTPPATPEPASAPQIPADFQAQLDAANARAAELEKQTRYQQSRADQLATQNRALVGVQPQADPLAPYVDRYKKQFNVDDDSARMLATVRYEADQQLAQSQQDFNSRLQAPMLVDNVLNQTLGQFKGVAIDPVTLHNVRQGLINSAMMGQQVDPETAKFYLASEIGMRSLQPQGQPQAQPQRLPQFDINGMYGPASGYAQPQARAQAPAATPDQLQLRAELEARMKQQ